MQARDQLVPYGYTDAYFHIPRLGTIRIVRVMFASSSGAADRHAHSHGPRRDLPRERLFEFELDEYGHWATRRASSRPWRAIFPCKGRDVSPQRTYFRGGIGQGSEVAG